MSYPQIDSLTLEDTWMILLDRILDQGDIQTPWVLHENDQLDFYDRIIVDGSLTKPSQAVLDAELVSYKAELTTLEDARVAAEQAKAARKVKVDALDKDTLRSILEDLSLDIANVALLKEQLINDTDETLLDSIEAQKSTTEQRVSLEVANEALVKVGAEKMSKGSRVVALINGINSGKTGLTTGDIQTLISTYDPIIKALQTGSLETAKALIEAETPDGVVMLQADKDKVVAELNKLIGA